MLISPAEIAEDRLIAEQEMVDRCRITRAARPGDPGYTAPVLNEETGQYTTAPRVTVYEGKCRIQVRSDINSNAVEAVVGEHEWTYTTSTLQLPMAATGVVPDCQAELLEVPLDSSLVGRVFNLQADVKAKTHATHRRFRALEVVA